jgi:carbon-monoxide dehydrogenase large subunit
MEVLAPRFWGARVRRVEDPRFLTGRASYVDDIQLPGMLHAAFVRSPHAHARVVRVDASRALSSGLALAVLLPDEAAKRSRPVEAISSFPGFKPSAYPCLQGTEVRYVGEPVALVVARDRYAAEDAVELVDVEYEPLPAVVDPVEALASHEILVHQEWGDNVALRREVAVGDVDAAFREAAVVIRGTYRTQRYTGIPMECRGVIADFNPATNELTVWSSTQIPHLVRTGLADALDHPENKIRVIAPDVGGGFGIKSNLFPEEIAVSLMAKKLHRPIKWIEDRREHILTASHAREHVHEVEAAFAPDGRCLALKARVIVDVGAYSVWPWTSPMEMGMAMGILPGPYKIRNYKVEGYTVATNKCPLGPYRGVARPAACFTIERVMDEAAQALGIDPVEIRLRNFVQPDEFPYTSVTGLIYDSGSFVESLQKAAEEVGYQSFRSQQEQARAQGRYIGIGFAAYTEQTAHTTVEFVKRGVPVVFGYETAQVRMDPSGKVVVATGIHSHGQGLETSLAQVVADTLQVDLSDVVIKYGDTLVAPYGMGTFASRSAVLAGGAAVLAARDVLAKARRIAAAMLEASADDVEVSAGRFFVKGSPDRFLTWRDVARAAYHRPERLPEGEEPGLEAVHYYEPKPGTGTFANSAHVTVVEVDPETGFVKLLRYLVVEDCGKIINPMIVDGQVHGGVTQGIGGALFEELVYDQQGQLLNTSFMDYLIPTATDVPAYEVHHIETPSPLTVGGIKGMGEGGAIAPGPAIANAVCDALRPFGVRVTRLPLTPERVKSLIAGREA